MTDEKEAERIKPSQKEFVPRCPACAAFPKFEIPILNPFTGRTVRLYQCECGQRIWDD